MRFTTIGLPLPKVVQIVIGLFRGSYNQWGPFCYEIACCAHRFRIITVSGLGSPTRTRRQQPSTETTIMVTARGSTPPSAVRGLPQKPFLSFPHGSASQIRDRSLHRKLLLPHSRQNCNKNHATIFS